MRSSRREEYTKRFEELTKQEIKNYNDSLLNTHVALEEFRRKLKDSVDQYAQQVAVLSSQIKKLESDNRDLKTSIVSLNKKLESQTNDHNKLERDTILYSKEFRKFQDWTKQEVSRLCDGQSRVSEIVQDNTFMMKRRVEDVFQDIGHCYRKSKADNEQLKLEILSIPSEAKQVRDELLEKAAISAVDNAGLLKEVAIVKKRLVIQESMNKYFHTQISRLKEERNPE